MKRSHILLVLALLVGALLLRCMFMADIFLEEHILPWGPDSFYHLWRIDFAVHNGLAVPRFDPFLNAPFGSPVIWPDGFDAFIAAIVWLLHGGDASTFDLRATALFVLPLLATAGCYATYWVAKRAFSVKEGLVAMALAALLPIHIYAGMLGRVDHHILELVLPPLALVAVITPWRSRWFALVPGAALAALVYGCPGALLPIIMVVGSAFFAALCAALNGDFSTGRRILEQRAMACAAAALLVAPDALGRSGFAFSEPSLLPITLLVGAAVEAWFFGINCTRVKRLLAAALVFGSLAFAAALWVFPDAFGFLAGQGPVGMLGESLPLWRSFDSAINFHSYLLFAVPPAAIWLMWQRREPLIWGLGIATVGSFILTVLQIRFGVIAALPAAVFLSAAMCRIWSSSRPLGRAALALVIAACLWQPVNFLRHASLISTHSAALLDASLWLQANTPSAGERSPATRADWSILTHWGDGTKIAYLANRPTIVGAFYHSDYAQGFNDGMALLYGSGPVEPEMARRTIRYIAIPALTVSSQEGFQRFVKGSTTQPPLYARLYDSHGAAIGDQARTLPALGRYRLVHESPQTATRRGTEVAAFKIFQRVPGARLTGGCSTRATLAKIRVTSDQGRQFDYVDSAQCENGRWEIRAPYAGEWTLKGSQMGQMKVTEQHIQAGTELPFGG
jgi:dolichyl-diphosphooligosaccharide--protein glycosyltransferase